MSRREKLLAFSKEVQLPLECATETFGFLGRKGQGKTYGAQKFFELLHDAGVQCVALDPVGNWWSLRVGKDGTSDGLKVYVFGGPRGDVPLLPDAGAFTARVIVERGISVILDVSRFRKNERKRFMTAFAEEFFHLKKDNISPVHLFVEEAHKFVPQLTRDNEEQMLGAMEDIVRLGRNYGIGVSLISQRSASVNKDVLTQVECLVAYQTGSAQDRKAIKGWVEENDEEGISLLAEMKTLHRGEALFWSPSALRVFKKIHICEKRTLDASSTPKIGERSKKPVKLAKVDLEGIHAAMKEVVATAEANDTTALKKKVKLLEAELLKKQPAAAPGKTREVKVAVFDPKQVARIEQLVVKLKLHDSKLTGALAVVDEVRDRLAQSQQAVVSEIGNLKKLAQTQVETTRPTVTNLSPTLVRDAVAVATRRQAIPRIGATAAPTVPMRKIKTADGDEEAKVDGPCLRVLGALAWFEAVGVACPSHNAIAFLANYSGETNGAYKNARGKLRALGLVTYPSPSAMEMTDEGRSLAPDAGVPHTGDGLRAAVMAKLDGPCRRVLQPLIDAYPDTFDVNANAKAASYSDATNGAYKNARGRLRALGLVEYPSPNVVRATDILFPDLS